MESMTIKCPLTVKAKVTERLKKNLTTEMQENIKKVDLELQQIEFQAKRALAEQVKQDAQRAAAIRYQIETERHKRLELKNRLLDRMKRTTELEIGSEIVQGTLERTIEIRVGDNLPELMNAEILVEDGKIIAFRS